MPSSVSTLVVTWNSTEFLARCLESLGESTEVIVVDNASTDGSAELVATRFPSVKLIRLDDNRGFAGGVNRAAAEATGDYLLLLNPDAEATPRAIVRLAAFLDAHPRCGAVGGRLLTMTEEPQRGFNVRRLPTMLSLAADLLLVSKVWPTNPVTRRYLALDVDDTQTGPVEQPAAAALMVRRAAFDEVGRMDEHFHPAWFEDVDLCRRLLVAGWAIYLLPESVFRHIGGRAYEQLGRERFSRIWYRNMERYVRKHHGRIAAALLRAAIVTGMALRIVVSFLRADRAAASAFGGVLSGTLTGWKRS